MRIGSNTPFWVVSDPIGGGTINDILGETTLPGLERQFPGRAHV